MQHVKQNKTYFILKSPVIVCIVCSYLRGAKQNNKQINT